LEFKKLTTFDQKILLQVQKWRLPSLTKLFLFLTYSGTGRVWLILALLMNLFNFIGVQFVPNQIDFLRSMFFPLLAWIIGSAIKKKIARERPSETIEGYARILKSPTCGSFPSTHAASTTAFYFALQFMHHPFALFIGLWALLVSFSRLYLGVHYLTDIAGGALLGFVTAVIFFQTGIL
jgi:undecaprenyl-diphosphatase